MPFENTKIRLSYTHFYQRGVSLNKVLPKQISEEFVLMLSAIGYDTKILNCFKSYCKRNFCNSEIQKKSLQEEELIEPHTSYLAWKIILARSEVVVMHQDFKIMAKKLFDFLLKVNSILDKDDNLVSGKFASLYSEHLFLDYYQDNIVSQFYRTQNIILDSDLLKPYFKKFEQNYQIDIKKYVYITYRLLVRYGNIWGINKDGLNNEQLMMYWKSFPTDIAEETNFDQEDILKVINIISKDFRSFKNEVGNEYLNYINIDNFKNSPFLKLKDESIVPINNRLAENLIFYNLFYKIVDLDKNNSDSFRQDFGKEFECYIVNLALEIQEQNKDCIIQEEFAYSINRKKQNNKSPDLMIIYPDKKEVIVFEVKSAQILDAYNKEYTNKELYTKCVEKTVIRPLKQAVKAISDINSVKATSLFDESYSYLFVSVTMTGFVIPNYKIRLEDEKVKVDVSNKFFNMPVETFEIFVRILSASQAINGFELLNNYNLYRERMSLKTYLHRMEKELNLDISSFETKMINGQKQYLNYINPNNKN